MAEADTEYYMPGDILYEGEDFAHVIFRQFRKEYCDYCCTRNTKVRLCSKCLYVGYCNKTCQGAAWPVHKLECKTLIYFDDSPDWQDDVILFFARIIRKLETLKEKTFSEKVGNKVIKFDDLKKLDGTQNVGSVLNFWSDKAPMIHCLKGYLDFCGIVVKKDISVLSYQILRNKGMLRYDKEFGMFFCLGRSIFQFSCLPNAVDIIGNKRPITHQVRATQKIPKGILDKVYLPTQSTVECFCLTCNLLAWSIHANNDCHSCKSEDSAVSRIILKDKAHDIITNVQGLFARILLHSCQGCGLETVISPDAHTRKEVDYWLKRMRGVLADTHQLRLQLLFWKVLFDHQDLFVVKHHERSFIHLIKSLHGEHSYELYLVYHYLVEIYVEHKKWKAAKNYRAKRDEIGRLYGMVPLHSEADDIIDKNDKSS